MTYTVNCKLCDKEMQPNESLRDHIFERHCYELDIFFYIKPRKEDVMK